MADIFVEMEKDGEHLVVHPTTVEAHKRVGWKVVKEGVSIKGAKVKDPDQDEGKTPETEKEPDKK